MVVESDGMDNNIQALLSPLTMTSEIYMKLSYRSAPLLLCLCVFFGLGCATGQMSSPGPTVVDADAPTEFTTTSSGLKYRVLRKGDGNNPRGSDRVTVHYKGWLDSGKIFDSSYTKGEPISFGLKEVVRGWTEGLQLVNEGGMIELEIPSPLGYGAQGPPGIPPNSTLHFIVELIKVQ